jgi:uncharacterized protein
MPKGIARICNDATRAKTRFYVAMRVRHHTRAWLRALRLGKSIRGHSVSSTPSTCAEKILESHRLAVMNNLHLTLLFAGLCALLQCALTVLVVARRLKARVDLMDGGDGPLQRRIRAHGNFTETAPMALILIALLELRSVDASWLWALGLCLLLGRMLHAVGLLASGARWCRLAGMVLTLTVFSFGGVLCLMTFWK